jgi:hypothetical protein
MLLVEPDSLPEPGAGPSPPDGSGMFTGVVAVTGGSLGLILTRGWSSPEVANVLAHLAPVLITLILCAIIAMITRSGSKG